MSCCFCMVVNAAEALTPAFLSAPSSAMPGEFFELTVSPQADATYYEIYDDDRLLESITTPSVTQQEWSGGRLFKFKARACDENSCGGFGNIANVFITSTRHKQVIFTAPERAFVGQQFCIEFEEQDDIKRYYLERAGTRVGSATESPVCATVQDQGIHNFSMTACGNHFGCSPASPYTSIPIVTPPLPAEAANAPTLTMLQSTQAGRFNISYTQVDGAENYEIYENDSLVETTTALSTTSTIWGQGIYRYKVRACENTDCGPFSAEVNVVVSPGIRPALFTAPETVTVDSTFCIDYEEQAIANRYFVKRSGVTYARPKSSPVCVSAGSEHDKLAIGVEACSRSGCADSYLKTIYVLPEYLLEMNGLQGEITVQDGAGISLSFDPVVGDTEGPTTYQLFENSVLKMTATSSPFVFNSEFAGFYDYQVKACSETDCGNLSNLTRVEVSFSAEQLAPLAAITELGQSLPLSWTRSSEDIRYRVHTEYQGEGAVQNGFGELLDSSSVTIGPFSAVGYYCFYVLSEKNGVSVTSNEVCTHVVARATISDQISGPVILAQNDSYHLAASDFNFSTSHGAYTPVRIEAGEHYQLTEDELTLSLKPGFFGDFTATVIFTDSHFTTQPYDMQFKAIDGRPKAISKDSFRIDYKESVWISPYDADTTDPRGLPIIATTIVGYPIHGSVTILHDGKIIEYTNIANKCEGNDAFSDTLKHTVTNSAGLVSEVAETTLEIRCPFLPNPVARGDVVSYNKNRAIPIHMVENDYDPYARPIRLYEITKQPLYGELRVTNTSPGTSEVLYIPNHESCQLDWFYYSLENSLGYKSKPNIVVLDCGVAPPTEWRPLQPLVFESDNSAISLGESVHLSWAMHSDDSRDVNYNLFVERPDGSARYQILQNARETSLDWPVTMPGEHLFLIQVCTLDGECGDALAALVLTVEALDFVAPVTVFSVDARQINHGDSVTLSWTPVENTPSDSTYNLYVTKPSELGFPVTPRFLWRVLDASARSTVRGGDTGIQRTGTQTIEIEVCRGAICSDIRAVDVTVDGPPAKPWIFEVNNSAIESGESVQLSWAMHSNYQLAVTYNLFAEKPDGSVRFQFQHNILQTSFNRVINLAGVHRFYVQACEVVGGECGEVSEALSVVVGSGSILHIHTELIGTPVK